MPPENDFADAQDQSEVFDETHLDDEGDGDVMLDTADPVVDLTQAEGDADEDDLDLEDQLALDGVEPAADGLMGVDATRVNAFDTESNGQRASDEVELVYSGLMENVKGAQASAAHWESRRLDDDDIADLGYAPGEDQAEQSR